MKKYILFGAGYYATVAISLLGKENIEFIMDNNRDKAGSSVEGIAVYPYCEKKSQCGHYTIVISVSDRYCPQIEEQLKKMDSRIFNGWKDTVRADKKENRRPV